MCFIPGQMECKKTENGGWITKATKAFIRRDKRVVKTARRIFAYFFLAYSSLSSTSGEKWVNTATCAK